MILITGAAGKTGTAILRVLARKGEPTRALIRRNEQAAAVRQAGAQEVIAGELLDPAALRKAVEGVNAIYLICPNVHPQEFEIGQATIAAAKDAGVRLIAYHSVLYPQIEAMPHHWQKLRVEEALIQSGLDFTILQPASYMQNILPYWEQIIRMGTYSVPYSPESVFSPVDLEDVAEAAAKVLLETHAQAVYPLAGPERLSSTDMANLIGEKLGRKVQAIQQPQQQWIQHAKTGNMSSYAVETLSKMFAHYDKYGIAGNSDVLQMLLGRNPATFGEFLSKLQI